MTMPTVIIDSREQKPYSFSLPSVTLALPTGDYSLVGLESVAAVERKELGDFISCCCQERGRFEKELERTQTMKRLWVVIEGNLSQIVGHEYRSEVNPESVIGSIAAWECRFDAVRFCFCSNRQVAQRITAKLLIRAWKEFSSGTSRTIPAVVE